MSHEFSLTDPREFAERLWSSLCSSTQPRVCSHAPREFAALECASEVFMRALPTKELRVQFGELEELAMSYATESYFEGIRYGIAADAFRRSLLVLHEGDVCMACGGRGTQRLSAPYDVNPPGERIPVDCTTCGGEGYVTQ